MQRLIRLALLLYAGLLVAPISSAAETFQSAQFLPTPGGGFYQMLAGDLSGSGHQDLVYWSYGGPSSGDYWYEVMRNEGQRQFKSLGQVPFSSPGVSQAVLRDFNGDGKADLVFVSWYYGLVYTITFLPGNGDGTFGAPIVSQIQSRSLPGDSVILEVFAADMNGDGKLDLAISSGYIFEADNSVNILRGDGTGRFSLESAVANVPGSLVGVADVNGDGKGDLVAVTVGFGRTATVYLNQGAGNFRQINSYMLLPYTGTTYGAIRGIAFADFNGDGIIDLVCNDGLFVDVGLGRGDGTFASTLQIPLLTNGFVIGGVDMNGDGIPDIELREDQGITVLLGGHDLSFTKLPVALAAPPSALPTVADLDGDGYPDAIVPGSESDGTPGATLLWGTPTGRFEAGVGYRAPYFLVSGAMAKFTQGTAPDIAVQPYEALLPLTFHNAGDGTFQLLPDPNAYSVTDIFDPSNTYTTFLETGDFNGDGLPDLLSTDGVIAELTGNGNGYFSSPVTVKGVPNSTAYESTVAGDLNGDGTSDIAIAYVGEIDILLSQKDGGWKQSASFQDTGFTLFTNVAFGDWNGDGIIDMAILTTNQMQVYLGRGDGTFQSGQSITLPVQNTGAQATAADVDGDGNIDIFIGDGSGLYFIYGNGDGTFHVDASSQLLAPDLTSAQVADVNRDGFPDLVLLEGFGLIVRHGLGNRKWDAGDQYISGGSSYLDAFWAQDINQDGFPDIALVEYTDNRSPVVGVILNRPGPEDLTGTLTISPEPQAQGASATASVSLNPAVSGARFPSGTMQIAVDSEPAGTGILSNGKLQISLIGADKLLPGRHWVVASYPGDSIYHAAQFTAAHYVSGQIAVSTSTTLTASPNPINLGATLTLNARVSAAKGTAVGVVDFIEGTTLLGQATLSSTSTAGIPLNTLTAGKHLLVAKYLGTSGFASSTSTPVTVTVNSPNTITTLAATPNPAVVAQTVTLTADVSADTALTGSVTFFDGQTSLGNPSLSSNGAATLNATFALAGPHTLIAKYSGDALHDPSTSTPYALIVQPAPSSTSIISTHNPAPLGSSITFTTSISTAAPANSVTGTISFMDGKTLLGKPLPIVANESASYTTNSLSLGTHPISAVYSGATSVLGSTSPILKQIIVPYLGDFSIEASPTSASFYTGEAAHFDVAITPSHGFAEPLILSCVGLPAATTFAFSPASIAGGQGTAKLIIQTAAPHQSTNSQEVSNHASRTVTTSMFFAAFALVLFPSRRQRSGWFSCLALAILGSGLALSLSGCGAVSSITGGTPPGSYTISVIAQTVGQGPSMSHSTSVTIHVKSLF